MTLLVPKSLNSGPRWPNVKKKRSKEMDSEEHKMHADELAAAHRERHEPPRRSFLAQP